MSVPTRCASSSSSGSAGLGAASQRKGHVRARARHRHDRPAEPRGRGTRLANLRRFVALARALGVDHLAIIATAAVREASDGAAFAAEAERQCGVPVRIIGGGEEARLSAAGVLAGIRGADGVVGDLGGGSVELVRVGAGGAGCRHDGTTARA